MEAGRSFAELFGGPTTSINFSVDEGAPGVTLAAPEPSDSLDDVMRKMRALAEVVERGRSVAVATGFKRAAHQERDPMTIAKQAMTPMELQQYEAWSGGVVMPPLDLTTMAKAVPLGAASHSRMEQRAAAMRIIWKMNGITAETASWVTSNMNFALPLIIAVGKIESAKRELLGGQSELTDMELAEVQTIHKVIGVGMDVLNQVCRRLNESTRQINHAREILQAREHALKAKMSNYKKREDPINQARALVGLSEISGSVNFSAATTGRRISRDNLLAGTGVGSRKRKAPTPGPSRVTRARTRAISESIAEDSAE